ncbi:MAG: DoxX family membrane protein [Actinobacteria bacterium]|nr:DoxX family membrane protein [Actinomycetota bacterium]
MSTLHKKYQPFITLLCRILLGGVLLVAGGLKAFKPSESASAVAAYKILPINLAHLMGYALPWLEIALGILLIIGLTTRLAAVVGTAIMIVFTAAIISVWARGILIDCGCFGGGGEVDASKAAEAQSAYLKEILRDLGLALCGTYLYFFPYGRLSIEKPLHNIEEQ